MKTTWFLLFLLGSLLASTQLGAETIYRWVDDEGVTHFTAHPPKNRESTLISSKKSSGRQSSSSEASRAEPAAGNDAEPGASQATGGEGQRLRVGPSEEERREACERALANIRALEGGRRVQIEDGDSFRYLTEAEQAERLEQARRIRDQACTAN